MMSIFHSRQRKELQHQKKTDDARSSAKQTHVGSLVPCTTETSMPHVIRSSVPETSISQLFRGTYAWTVTCNLLHWCLCGDRHRNVTCEVCCTTFEVSQVDFFISHSWSGPATLKALAICHHLNLDWAIASAIFATLFGTCIFYFGFYRGESSYDSRESLETPCMWLMKLFPITVFIVTYLFGHFIRKKTFWFDQISVNQVNLLVKSKTISQIPTFIARSSHLLVLWDDSFFDRLWCNFELAVHAKLGPLDSIQIVPMWQPLQTLFLFGLASIISFPYQYPQDHFDTKSRFSFLISYVKTYTMPMSLDLLVATGVACFAFEKLRRHKSMLASMASFDIRNAKCALETDRIVIEEQVFRLFDEALEPAVSVDLDDLGTADLGCGPRETPFLPLISPDTLHDIRHITSYPTKDEVMDQFNLYVRGPLRNAALSWTGQPGYMSFKLCVVGILPWLFASLFGLITCNGHKNCEAYALEQGYSSMALFLGVNGACLLFLQNLTGFLIIPLLLRANEVIDEVVSNGVLKRLLGSFSGAMILCVLDYVAQAQSGMLIVVATKYSPLWLACFLGGLTLEFIALWAVFFRSPSSSLRCLAPSKVTEKP